MPDGIVDTDGQELPPKFQDSFNDRAYYPENLIHQSIYSCTAGKTLYWNHLEAARGYLFQQKGADALDVRFREHGQHVDGDMDKQNVWSLETLASWLGITIWLDPKTGDTVIKTKRKDPRSRFIYIYADNSRARLNITQEMLILILTYHQVMPAYLDFLLVFGQRSEQPDERFSGFKTQRLFRKSPTSANMEIPELGRSGRHYQMCYNLKCVDLKARREGAIVNEGDSEDISLEEWTIRQAAIHHQFDVVEGTALWIVTKGDVDLQQRYKDMTAGDSRPEDRSFTSPTEVFRSTLAVHLMFCYWAIQDWKGHVRWLEKVVDSKSLMAVVGDRGPDDSHQTYDSTDVQSLQHWEERAQLAIDVMQGNLDVMELLYNFYDNLGTSADFPLQAECADFIDEFTSEVKDMTNTLRMQVTRTRGLVRLVRDRRQLVTQHLQSQAAERMEALSSSMERQSSSMEKEAIVVRIITLVTLVYLPATFVSTFFSTDVIKYQNQEDGTDPNGTFSDTAMMRWLQVALPLTFFTLLFAWCAKNWAEKQRLREKFRSSQPTPAKEPQVNEKKDVPGPGISPASTASTAASWLKAVAARRSRGRCFDLESQKR